MKIIEPFLKIYNHWYCEILDSNKNQNHAEIIYLPNNQAVIKLSRDQKAFELDQGGKLRAFFSILLNDKDSLLKFLPIKLTWVLLEKKNSYDYLVQLPFLEKETQPIHHLKKLLKHIYEMAS